MDCMNDDRQHVHSAENTAATHLSAPNFPQERDRDEETVSAQDSETLLPSPVSPCQVSLEYCEHDQQTFDIDPDADLNIGGFDTRVVKTYVSSLTDRSVLRRLQDQYRNQAFRNVLLHKTNCEDVVLFDADDIVLEYRDSGMFWYIKQAQRHMSTEERDKLAYLHTAKQAADTDFTDIRANAARDLHALRDLLRFYTG